MYDSLTWVVGILSTLIGIAGLFLLAFVFVLSFFAFKNIPNGYKKIISTMATIVVFLAFFGQLTAQNLIIFTYKSIFNIDLLIEMFDVTLLMTVFIAIFSQSIFSQMEIAPCGKILTNSHFIMHFANNKKLSSPSSSLKVSSVLLN